MQEGRGPLIRSTGVPRAGAAEATTRSGRSRGTMDTGTVALALGAMSFYWTLPLALGRPPRRRRRRSSTVQPAPPSPNGT